MAVGEGIHAASATGATSAPASDSCAAESAVPPANAAVPVIPTMAMHAIHSDFIRSLLNPPPYYPLTAPRYMPLVKYFCRNG